jgi:hypothetical protein
MTSGSNCGRWSGQGATVTVFVLLGLWVFWSVAGALVRVAEDTRGVSDFVVCCLLWSRVWTVSCLGEWWRGLVALVCLVCVVCFADRGGDFHGTFCCLECCRW